jgi:hypothetical protein
LPYFIKIEDANHRKKEVKMRSVDSSSWGGWQLYANGEITWSRRYPVDLERLTTSAEVLDLICQVANKRWANDACVAGLVHLLNDLLHPQAYLCSGGSDRRLSGDEIRQRVADWMRRYSARAA